MTKHREDLELIALSKNGDKEAQMELWNKWENFTKKQFAKSRETFLNSGSSLEDYMQDAFFAFRTAIEKYDLDRAKESGSSHFSTVYYFYLLKMKVATEKELSRFGGPFIPETSFQGEDKDGTDYAKEASDNPWNKAITRDIKEEFKRVQAEEVAKAYLEQEKDSTAREVFMLILEGKKSPAIAEALGADYTKIQVRNLIKSIYRRVSKVAEKVMFEPI